MAPDARAPPDERYVVRDPVPDSGMLHRPSHLGARGRRSFAPDRRRARVAPPLVAALLAGACGGDATAPTTELPGATTPTLQVTVAPGDTVYQRGLEFTARLSAGPLWGLTITTDAGTADERRRSVPFLCSVLGEVTDVAFPPTPGRHTVTLTGVDSAGRAASFSTTRTFVVADAPYTAVPLPGGGGLAADAIALNDRGDVAGWVTTASGPGVGPDVVTRPAVWRGGRSPALEVLPVSDSVSAQAVRINAAGDVLVQYTGIPVGRPGFRTAARVWRADGRLLVPGDPATDTSTCCTTAFDLNDRGQALVGTPPSIVRRYDLASGTSAASGLAGVLAPQSRGPFLNDAGQAAASVMSASGPQRELALAGLPAPPLTVSRPPTSCGPSRGPNPDVLGLAADGAILAQVHSVPALLTPAAGRALDVFLGPGVRDAVLSRRGGWVAGLDSAGAIHLWNAAEPRARRVRTPAGWRFDRVGAVNATAQIAAHGVDPATGLAAAVLLTPDAP